MVATVSVEAERDEDEAVEPAQRWGLLTRVLFRFGFVYLGIGMAGQWLFQAFFSSLSVPHEWVIASARVWGLRPVTDWMGRQVFGIDEPISWAETGSGDTTANWLATFTWLVVAALVAAVWSVADRRRVDYTRLLGWLLLVLRFSLATSLLLYGMVKVLPSQMAFDLHLLIERFGDMSPMGVLWAQTAVSQPYEIALGFAEVTAALLLFLPVTATAGALLALVVCLQVLVLNLAYDVPVKLYALHLLLFALVLLLPEANRLARVLVGRAVGAANRQPLLGSGRGRRVAAILQAVLAVWLVVTPVAEALDAWQRYGNARPKSPLYGIWEVTEHTVAGQELPALVSRSGQPRPASAVVSERLRRVVFDNPVAVTVQRMDDSLVTLPGTVDAGARTITLTQDAAGRWKLGTFTYQQPDSATLILEGQLGGRPVRLRMELVEQDSFPLIARGFHWVQEAPYRR